MEKKNITKISKSEFTQLLGLLTISRGLAKRMKDGEECAAEILKFKGDDTYDRGGWIISELIYEEGNIETDLRKKLKDADVVIK